jgi:hypothetical protein
MLAGANQELELGIAPVHVVPVEVPVFLVGGTAGADAVLHAVEPQGGTGSGVREALFAHELALLLRELDALHFDRAVTLIVDLAACVPAFEVDAAAHSAGDEEQEQELASHGDIITLTI